MAYGTINADVIQSSVTGVSLGAGNATRFKNRIINGNMVIDQRNAGASSTPATGAYTVDRWFYTATQASKFTVQQNAGSVTLPAGFINYLGMTVASAVTVGASDTFLMAQNIEGLNISDLGWGTANAKTVTLSFQVYSSLTGTFGGALSNSGGGRSYPFNYTISTANTWTSISVTVAGDTSGTWLTTNGVGLVVRFGLGSGSTFSGTAGAWASANYVQPTSSVSVVGTASATFYITGVQLEVGSSATGFEVVDYTTQLAMCQRYYETYTTAGNSALYRWYGGVGTEVCTIFPMQVTKRTAPTMAAGSGFTESNCSSTGFANITVNSYRLVTITTTLGMCYFLANSSITMSAEL